MADTQLLNLLADTGPLTIAEIVRHFKVTRTAVHERLLRLMGEGLVGRELVRQGRGRPSYRYLLSSKAHKLAGNNFADLAAVLWRAVLSSKDSRRRGVRRIASALTALYAGAIQGATLEARMESLCELLETRRVRCDVDTRRGVPTFILRDCPYLDLAAVDGSVCQMETMLFSQLLGDDVVLSQCRRDGNACCKFGPPSEAKTRKFKVTV